MDTLLLYFTQEDIDRFIHSRLSPDDAEKYKDTKFFVYQSGLNKNDMSIELNIVALSSEKMEKINREQIDIDAFASSIMNANEV